MSPLDMASRHSFHRSSVPAVRSSTPAGQTNTIWSSVAFLPDGNAISGSYDGCVRVWRAKEGHQVRSAMNEGGRVAALAVSSDGQWIAAGGEKTTITIWNAATEAKAATLKGHKDSIRSLAFSSDSTRLLSGSCDKTVVVWSAKTGKPLIGPLSGHAYSVGCARFSPNDDEIASCDSRDIRIHNSYYGHLVIAIHAKATSLAWAPSDGQRLVVGCTDGFIKVFNPQTGALLAQWEGHSRQLVHSILVSPNTEFIASGSWRDKVRLWDVRTYKEIATTVQHCNDVNSVAISPDSSNLAVGVMDNEVRFWNFKGIVSPTLLDLKNVPTTSNNAPPVPRLQVSTHPLHRHFHQENNALKPVSYPPLREAQDSIKHVDNDKHPIQKDHSEEANTTLQTRRNVSEPAQKEVTSAEVHCSEPEPPPVPPKIVNEDGKGSDPRPSVSTSFVCS
ncbi:hypothetical protein PAXRUDRAFT_580925 [Paxillus rubicundulus Ve08.2h10]|uniref:Anaphase-promoting complex subunit 4 WD40 domain-containing protein n=1 Tax=Paxillus rubicundulus Ve08.2h10 TaxID=930991 RepID=A0A0D0DLS3_9AGAM|nr:hypothetical protein PAXRUDRAFT_580925 [Paxillus rubicundulus Ve08.2h10]